MYVAICIGKNGYGHLTSGVLNSLKSYKVKVFRTDKQRTIIPTTNEITLTFNVKPIY